ncbi:hypothetical protein B9K05_09515 [Acetobacter syzygii]|uniref:Transposase InsH N-terminal domain-containing protein n=1 Tax=Acetobacter syzygii TaxID=146476 RepID=A0A270BGJ3_9PROT|nr:hypothetical protein B9K05_09515 [Acetobacter syzygii]PAL24719.1 hypothetical protein B9K04_09005 [Acetobacter syzygii]
MFSYIDLASRVRARHPLRAIGAIADDALVALSKDFAALYSGMSRPSIAPAMPMQSFYVVRSEQQLIKQLEFDLLVRRPRHR